MVAAAHAARTAGLIVVGDEVLSGAVPDTNSHFVSQRLHRLGVRLLKVVVVPDDVEAVASEVREFSGCVPSNCSVPRGVTRLHVQRGQG